MKAVFFSSLFLVLTAFISADENAFKIAYETIAIDNIPSSSNRTILECGDKDHHKTLIKITKYPDEKELIITFKRPVFENLIKNEEHQLKVEDLCASGRALGENSPATLVSSRGYLPGEKIIFQISSVDGFLSETIAFYPNPLIITDSKSEAKVTAELKILAPAKYQLFFEGFKKGEKLQFKSESSGEVIDHQITYEESFKMHYSPGVLGQKGGYSQISLVRENGEHIKFPVPWGTELIQNLRGISEPLVRNFATIEKT